ncbi:hypothetical protein [Xenorhabdus griffiniae]
MSKKQKHCVIRDDKTMRYSLGNPTFEYKNRWCETLPLGKVLF